MYSVSRLFVMFGIPVPYCDCLITVGSNPISASNFDPLRGRSLFISLGGGGGWATLVGGSHEKNSTPNGRVKIS